VLKRSMDPYRAPRLPEDVPPPPKELVYEANERDRNTNIQVAWFQFFGGPMLVGVLLASLIGGITGLLGFAGAMIFSIWYRKRSARADGAVLRIDEDRLHVLTRDLKDEKAFFLLRELAGVELDVKTIERLQDGNSPIPALRFANPTIAPPVDTARVVLVGTKGRRYFMTDVYLAHMDATESVGKIRVFLRKNGWLPASERKKKKRRAEAREEAALSP
jgi:hypothetical protein